MGQAPGRGIGHWAVSPDSRPKLSGIPGGTQILCREPYHGNSVNVGGIVDEPTFETTSSGR